MKFVLFLALVIPSLWSLRWFQFGNPLDMLVSMYRDTLPSVTWGLAVLYLYDFSMAMLKKNSPYMIRFHNTLKKDFIVLFLLSAFTVVIYSCSPQKFTAVSLDISMAGFSFMVMGNLGLLRLFKYKVGAMKYPKLSAFAICLVSIALSLYFLSVTLNVANSVYETSRALWSQITVFCFSISLFFFSSQIIFFMDNKTIEPSPVIMDLLKRLKPTNKLYEISANAAGLWNEAAKRERAKFSAQLRKNKKGRKRSKH
ncbi:TPA: hypothetical protein ACGE6V_002910 [Serratia marcescens]|uniref:hypothetical protein n=1 Tax=Serratia marcescens TaxID=615 RepID=UPI0037002C39